MDAGKLSLLYNALKNFKSDNTPQEKYLSDKVWFFEFNHISRVYLFLRESIEKCIEKDECFIEGFFSLNINYPKRKDVDNIDEDLLDRDKARVIGVLIGQLAKYRDENYISPLNAEIILFYAEKMVREADSIVPFRCILIETETEKVKQLYEKCGYSFLKKT